MDNNAPRSSAAVVVDSADLESIMTDADMEDATIEELQPLDPYSDSSSYLASEEEEDIDMEEKEEEDKDSSETESNQRIRAVTNQYLEGAYSLADLTAALKEFKETPEMLANAEENNQPGCSKTQPTVIKPTMAVMPKAVEKPRKSDGTLGLGFGFDTSMLPPESTWEQRPKYTADFYSTGEQVSSFTLRRRRKMSPTVQGMMGEAHLRYVRGELKSAIGICQEIIKEQPTITDPYALLSLIYWDLNENDRALRFGMIGAFLDPKHCKEWPRLAEWSLGQGNIQQAISCYTHALSVSPGLPDLYFRRCELMKLANDTGGAIKGYHRLIQALPKDGKSCVQAYRKIALLHYADKDKEKAYHVLLQAFGDYPQFVTNIEVNLILELMKSFKKYVEAIQLLQKHSNVTFKPVIEKVAFTTRITLSKTLSKVKSITTPPTFPAELNVKLITALIHLEAYDLAKGLVPQLLTKPIDKFGDLYLEVAEAYMAKGRWSSSLELTSLLVKSPNMKEASLCFLRHAETLYSLGKLDDAAVAYEMVISLVPNHNVAKLNYALILQKLGRSEDALLTLDQNEEEKTIDHHLIAEKCKIYIRQRRADELLKTTLFLLSRHCHTLRSKEDTLGVSMTNHADKRYESVQVNRSRREEHPFDKRSTFLEKSPIIDVEWKIYLHACQVCFDMERYDLLERLTYTAWSSEIFGQYIRMEKACGYHAYLASLLNLDHDLIVPHVKYQSLNPQGLVSTMDFNLFAKAMQRHGYVRYGSHLNRLVMKSPDDMNLKLLTAHHNFSCGNCKTALTQYFYVYSKYPDNPLVSLMISSCLLSLLNQKTAMKRSQLAVQAIAFIQSYLHHRGPCQESYYNVGRTLHTVGAYQDAVAFYLRALEEDPVTETFDGSPLCSDLKRQFVGDENKLDLRKDILFNLATLYASVGSVKIARYYMYQIKV